MTDALKAAKGTNAPIKLMVQDEDTIAPMSLTCNEGLRHPRFSSTDKTADMLTEILAPMTSATTDLNH